MIHLYFYNNPTISSQKTIAAEQLHTFVYILDQMIECVHHQLLNLVYLSEVLKVKLPVSMCSPAEYRCHEHM